MINCNGKPTCTKSKNEYSPGCCTSKLTGDEIGVTYAAEQAIATVIANAWGGIPKVIATSIAIGAMRTAVAVFEINRPTKAVMIKMLPSITTGAIVPIVEIIRPERSDAAPVLFSAVAPIDVSVSREYWFEVPCSLVLVRRHPMMCPGCCVHSAE